MTDQTQHKFAPSIILECFEEEAILIHLDSDQIFKLNATGMFIAQLIDAGHTESEIISAIVEGYDLEPQIAEQEFYEFMELLQSQDLIREMP